MPPDAVKGIRPGIGLAFAMCLFATGGASAQAAPSPPRGSPDDPAVQRALELAAEAERAFEEGEAERAIALLRDARSHFAAPVLLYNIGKAHEALGRTEEAIAAYEAYLREEPTAPDREALERHITTLRARSRPPAAPATEPEHREPAPAPARVPSPPTLIGPLVVGGLAIGALAAGLIFGLSARNAERAAEEEATGRDAMATFEEAEERALIANLLFGAAAALAATSAVWLFVSLSAGAGGEGGLSGRLSMRVRF